MSFEARVWSTKEQNDLPDECFAYIEPGGKKDSEGKTVPRGLRHFPYKDEKRNLDEAHINAGFSYLSKAKLPAAAKKKIHTTLINACKKLGKEHKPCSFPGCKGTGSKKSMLEDYEAFTAFQKTYAGEEELTADWKKWDESKGKTSTPAKTPTGVKKAPAVKKTEEKVKTTVKKVKEPKTKALKAPKEPREPKEKKSEGKSEVRKKSMLEDSVAFYTWQVEAQKNFKKALGLPG